MKILLSVLPIALLVAYSQIVVKWRTSSLGASAFDGLGLRDRILHYLSDPLLLSAYAAALLASFIWLFVVAKLPLAIAFPIYIGVTFVLVIAGSWMFLSENITPLRFLAAALILSGIALGVRN
ncbi:hypothetical protein [Herbaspirillum lusitanum]|uniref:hypothetical protein n=1 Tax=Herbaspirillum lusitanum TaxID=213312 RepID=UPI00037AD7ED|nr:hypothetical protein [Herbaspirillum lusitanum]